mmetsp:Transcript_40229/g.104214  ORF Transcript_40229/g.104214 Transcript_40229/m.104214 type:complete len:251 (-) Transcript_40229:2498-3250(-)
MPPHFAIDGVAKIVAQGFFDFLPVVVRSIHVNHFHLGGRRHAFDLGLLLGAWALFFSPLPFLRVPSFERRGRQPTSPFGGLIDQRVGVLTQVFCPLLAIGDAPGAIFDQVNRESPWIVLQSLKNLDLQVVDDQVLEGGDGLLAHGTLSLAARSLKHCHEPSRIKALHVCALRAPNGRLHAHSRNGTLEFHGDFVYLHKIQGRLGEGGRRSPHPLSETFWCVGGAHHVPSLPHPALPQTFGGEQEPALCPA